MQRKNSYLDFDLMPSRQLTLVSIELGLCFFMLPLVGDLVAKQAPTATIVVQSTQHMMVSDVAGGPLPAKSFLERAVEPSRDVADLPKSTDTDAVISIEIQPPVAIIDSRTFGDKNATVTLSHIETPSKDAVCINRDGAKWACGLWARAALNNIMRGGTIYCRGMRRNSSMVEAECRNNGGDLAAQLVTAGFARSRTGELFKAEEEAARNAQRGLWNGNWTLATATQ
ncbi:MAG: thermonuclease family protein [Beijerinckiaceae bacterium]